MASCTPDDRYKGNHHLIQARIMRAFQKCLRGSGGSERNPRLVGSEIKLLLIPPDVVDGDEAVGLVGRFVAAGVQHAGFVVLDFHLQAIFLEGAHQVIGALLAYTIHIQEKATSVFAKVAGVAHGGRYKILIAVFVAGGSQEKSGGKNSQKTGAHGL